MRKIFSGMMLAFIGAFAATLFFSCDGFRFADSEKVLIKLSFYQSESLFTKGDQGELPDTNSFVLDIRDESGDVVYNGLYGEKPEAIEVTGGTYIIKVFSSGLSMPRFSTPIYGDTRSITVDDEDISVQLMCKQINSGIKINFSENYVEKYRRGKSILRSEEGELEYTSDEDRTAFFSAGSVSLIYVEASKEESLLTRTLASGEILTLNIDCLYEGESPGSGGITITMDSTRVWRSEDVFLGRERDGSSIERAYTVSGAKDNIGKEEVWVCGYIVGGDLSQKDVVTVPPFTAKSNLAIADYSTETERENMVSIELSAAKIKEALNLVDNEGLFRKKIYVKGTIVESYFGLNGLKSVKEYYIEE